MGISLVIATAESASSRGGIAKRCARDITRFSGTALRRQARHARHRPVCGKNVRRCASFAAAGSRAKIPLHFARSDADPRSGATIQGVKHAAQAHAAVRIRVRRRAGDGADARAQPYPNKPIRMIVPFPPGGPIDTMARLTGQRHDRRRRPAGRGREPPRRRLHHRLARRSRRAEPDGYTLLFGSSGSLAVAPSLYMNAGYRSAEEFHAGRRASRCCRMSWWWPERAGQDRRRVRRLRQGQSRQAQLRRRARHAAALCSARCSSPGPSSTSPYVPYQGAAPSVTDLIGGPHALHHRRPADPDAADQGRASCARSRSTRAERWPSCRTCRRWWRAAIRISRSTPGPAWWRRPARRSRSSRGSTPRSTTGLKSPR